MDRHDEPSTLERYSGVLAVFGAFIVSGAVYWYGMHEQWHWFLLLHAYLVSFALFFLGFGTVHDYLLKAREEVEDAYD